MMRVKQSPYQMIIRVRDVKKYCSVLLNAKRLDLSNIIFLHISQTLMSAERVTCFILLHYDVTAHDNTTRARGRAHKTKRQTRPSASTRVLRVPVFLSSSARNATRDDRHPLHDCREHSDQFEM